MEDFSIRHVVIEDHSEDDYDICTDIEGDLTNSGDQGCAMYYDAPGECEYMDRDNFIAADLCCACGGGLKENFGQEGDSCLGWDDMYQK